MANNNDDEMDYRVFGDQLRSDRLIEIYVGQIRDTTRPFLVQLKVLEIATAYFRERDPSSELYAHWREGTYYFLQDDLDAWQVFLYWMLRRDLPGLHENPDYDLLLRCWVLGNKYDATEFKDDVTRAIVEMLEDRAATREEIKASFNQTPPGSKPRTLMAEEAVYAWREGGLTDDDFHYLEGGGFMGEFFKAEKAWDGRTSRKRLELDG